MKVIWGVHPVLERLKASPERIKKIIIKKNYKGEIRDSILNSARAHSIPVNFDTQEALQTLAGHSTHQGIVAFIDDGSVKILQDILDRPSTSGYGLVVIADGIMDPQNLGSLIRSAHAAGVQGIIVPKHRAAQVSGTVEKTSAGAVAYLPVVTVTNVVDTIRELKKAGYWVVGTAAEAGQNLYETDLKTDLVLIVGGEAKGIRPLVRKHCDLLLSIPMLGKVSSLNAAVAGAVILFEVLRQRSLTVS